jgi:hypothetical protein
MDCFFIFILLTRYLDQTRQKIKDKKIWHPLGCKVNYVWLPHRRWSKMKPDGDLNLGKCLQNSPLLDPPPLKGEGKGTTIRISSSPGGRRSGGGGYPSFADNPWAVKGKKK